MRVLNYGIRDICHLKPMITPAAAQLSILSSCNAKACIEAFDDSE